MMYIWRNMASNYLLLLFLLGLFVLFIWNGRFFQLEFIPKKIVLLSFAFKLVLAAVLWIIYTRYYTLRADADIFKYFDDAVQLFNGSEGDWRLRWKIITGFGEESRFLELIKETQHWSRQTSEPYNDNPIMIRLNFLILFFSKGFYPIHIISFCFFSFLGSIALLRFFRSRSKVPPLVLLFISCWIPSLVFWSSGVLKESWLFFCLGFFLLYSQNWNLRKRPLKASLAIFFFFLLFSIKPYFILCLLPALIYLATDRGRSFKKSMLLFCSIHLLGILIAVLFFDELLLKAISEKQNDFILLAQQSGAGSLFNTNQYNSLKDLFFHAPAALFASLFRPTIMEANSIFSYLSAAENAFFMATPLLALFYFKKPDPQLIKIILFCSSFILIGGILIGLSTPVMGALVRYKTPLIPFYLFLVLTFVDFRRIKLPLYHE